MARKGNSGIHAVKTRAGRSSVQRFRFSDLISNAFCPRTKMGWQKNLSWSLLMVRRIETGMNTLSGMVVLMARLQHTLNVSFPVEPR